ncbi:probable ubiquitin carboxyl-terminal hydrolase FAF isoform X4 [Malaya genurostris]|uniref:probable ubiquitin carboxyl-terminal hydrolase FAF isoform X4 n=1 Tax=Malaya genurostris TaxID=325434 RepID=UPI0026F39E67|nr:probable ubiquitin carboxyl-terminal hydrolase FAF isoform X4 [Malaya genurostris]
MTYDTGGLALDPSEEQNYENASNSVQHSDPNSESLIADFPEEKLSSLYIKISSSRWVVPVLPNQELECLLNAAIKLSQAGIDKECEPCMKFYRDGLTTSFLKILTDEAVSSWKYNIHHCILMSCDKLLHLIALHMKNDNPDLLNLLAVVFDPENKFHTQNASRQVELHLSLGESEESLEDSNVFARSPPEPKNPRGWLVDLINRFGEYNGFINFLDRIQIGLTLFRQQRETKNLRTGTTTTALSDRNTRSELSKTSNSSPIKIELDEPGKLTLSILYSLLRPFGQCAELLSSSTIEKFFMPIWDVVLEILQTLSDDELKREAKFEGKNDTITGIVKYARALINRVPNQEDLLRTFEMCRLGIILRVLQISSFNGKMNALNEINKVLGCVSYYPHRQITEDEMDGLNAVKMAELTDDYLFIASRQYLHLRRNGQILDINAPPPVCRNPHTISAAYDLLVALCQNCLENMKILVKILLDMFFTDIEPLREWEYLPPVGPRPTQGFCGLKNAGATCYMNSVLQQLFMVPSLRVGILTAQGASTNPNEDFSGEWDSHQVQEGDDAAQKNYHVGILKHVQAIFAHLGHSSLQYYTPRGLWSHFKLQGEPVNLREQQDAVEFFMSLFESLDEGLKTLGYPQLMGTTLGGCFSDQKICQDCPHRYSKDEPFSAFSVDIRNHSSLTDSLEQYVKGEILEGADAYHCDKCDKKVVTVKRLCVRKLPPVLAIQLKRFEYDYERVCAIKFNDYFEFPRWLDMAPYTVSGLAKIEGEVIDLDDNKPEDSTETRFQLTGIVVHSGQASGGHYFSYILHKSPDGFEKWYKFDDGEVSECKMNEDEEMKAQCFGGDYMGEVYDNNLKRMQYRRQKRWWNAYMLFYTRRDHTALTHINCIEQLSLAESKHCILPMPEPIERSVRTQNIRFLHAKSLFSMEFFTFIKKLVSLPQLQRSEKVEKLPPAAEELSLQSMQLASQFLFHSGYRTKKSIRGGAIDWYEILCQHLRISAVVRKWFSENILLNPPTRLSEYLLAAPSPEIRSVFGKLVVFFCHCAANDEPIQGYEGSNLSEQILIAALSLLKGDVADFGKNLPQYFNLFSLYASLGVQEKLQLIRLNVPAIFIKVALDEGPGGQIKYQYPDLSKLHHVVSHLIRSCDISSRCQSSNSMVSVKPNIYIDPHITYDAMLPLSMECCEYLFNRVSYTKRLIEDTNIGDEGIKLLQYCSWENPHFSRSLLAELLWHCGYAYWHEMRHHTELLLHILLIEDSWQNHRIHNAILGISDDREGLLDIIQRNKMNYQKRAYQCIKCMVQLFNRSRVALNMLHNTLQLGRQWAHAVEWLQDELDRHRGSGGQYNYNSWSPPAQSNDSTNSFVLERSQSARNVLQMAFEICPEEDQEDQNEHETEDNENFQVVISTPTAINDTTKHACVQKQQALLSTSQEENRNSSPSTLTNVSKILSKVNIHADVACDSNLNENIHNVNLTTKAWPETMLEKDTILIIPEKNASELISQNKSTSSPDSSTSSTIPNNLLTCGMDQQT